MWTNNVGGWGVGSAGEGKGRKIGATVIEQQQQQQKEHWKLLQEVNHPQKYIKYMYSLPRNF